MLASPGYLPCAKRRDGDENLLKLHLHWKNPPHIFCLFSTLLTIRVDDLIRSTMIDMISSADHGITFSG